MASRLNGLCGGLWALLAAVAATAPVAGASAAEGAAALQAPPTPTRSLRDNVPFEMPAPTEPQSFSGYAGAPPFNVVPRKDQLMFFPCTNCHGPAVPTPMVPNPEPRKLVAAPHPAALVHGGGRFWCLTCHTLKDRDHLHTLKDQPVDFDDSYLICGQCHFNRQKDWYFGGHGKRVANWQGKRTIYNCTYCHDPHDPSLKPRAPSAPPPVRAGLKPMPQENPHEQ